MQQANSHQGLSLAVAQQVLGFPLSCHGCGQAGVAAPGINLVFLPSCFWFTPKPRRLPPPPEPAQLAAVVKALKEAKKPVSDGSALAAGVVQGAGLGCSWIVNTHPWAGWSCGLLVAGPGQCRTRQV